MKKNQVDEEIRLGDEVKRDIEAIFAEVTVKPVTEQVVKEINAQSDRIIGEVTRETDTLMRKPFETLLRRTENLEAQFSMMQSKLDSYGEVLSNLKMHVESTKNLIPHVKSHRSILIGISAIVALNLLLSVVFTFALWLR